MMHTPGPWAIGKYDEVVDSSGNTIRVHGMTLTSGELAKANARLIAAAPELLEALQAVAYAADLDPEFAETFAATMSMVEEAIAKATKEAS